MRGRLSRDGKLHRDEWTERQWGVQGKGGHWGTVGKVERGGSGKL